MSVDDNYTKVLLHMDGSDGSTDFTDESGKVWTPVNTTFPANYPQQDTSYKKFGTGSGLFQSSSGSYLLHDDSSDFYLASGDFCFDFWMRLATIPAAGSSFRIFGQQTDSNNYMRLAVARDAEDTTTSLAFLLKTSGTSLVDMTRDVTVEVNTWYHVAVSWDGDNLYLFLNGSLLTPSLSYSGTFANQAAVFTIGQAGDSRYYNGWLDEFRFSKGVARWTDSFTPPAVPYAPRSSYGETGIFFD